MLKITIDNSKNEPVKELSLNTIENEFELFKQARRLLHNEGAFTAYIEDTNTEKLYTVHTVGELKAVINAVEVLELLRDEELPF